MSIATGLMDGGGDDTIYGGAGDDFIMGQQGADTIFGGAGDDDIIGGHNVAGGADGGDAIDGGAGDDVILGDNGTIYRKMTQHDARMRALQGTVMYGTNVHAAQGVVDDGKLLVTGTAQINVDGTVQREIVLFDHAPGTNASLFGNDYIAGGSEDDMIFGQLGDDIIQGDGSIDFDQNGIADVFEGKGVHAYRDGERLLVINASIDDYNGVGRDGDDYIEGNGGNDTVFGNLGRDDIIGGSSSLFGLTTRTQRIDGSDMLFGGSGTQIGRNELGDPSAEGHARDNDTIVGDNANIYRIVGTNGVSSGGYLTFAYDTYSDTMRIVPRGVELLDYTEGGFDVNPTAAALDRGAADEIHGEDGDDTIYGMVGDDVLFGDAHNDDIIGGTGNDWISGGTGSDGVIGDDGRIMTSRNSTVFGESLYGIAALDAVDVLVIAADQDALRTVVNRDGLLVKSVNLTPYSTNPNNPNDQYWNATNASDIIFGGWGSDFLHGGVGNDAISGAEALPVEARPQDHNGNIISFDTPFNPGNTAIVNETTFAGAPFPAVHVVYLPLLLAGQPRGVISFNANNQVTFEAGNNPFFLNFDHTEGQLDSRSENGLLSDGDDRIFGGIGHDIMFGGTGRDSMYGGYGNDLINGDDRLNTGGIDNVTTPNVDESRPGYNNLPDEDISYEDFIFGGAGRDFMIANTSGDRLVDWNGEFNEFFVPYRNAGAPTVITSFSSALEAFIIQVGRADGADPTRGRDIDPILAGNGAPLSLAGEPFGELGLVNNNLGNSFNLSEFQKQTGPGILTGRGTVDDGTVLLPDPIPVGARLANSPLDDYGFGPGLAGITGLYAGDASTVTAPITADTGADRPAADMITTFSQTVGIIIGENGMASVNGLTIGTEALSYVYNEETGEFEQMATGPAQVTGTNTVLELFDTNGELFAYVDEFGGVWIIDDILDNPAGQRDRVEPEDGVDLIEDDWLLQATVVSNGAAAVAMPFRTIRTEQ